MSWGFCWTTVDFTEKSTSVHGRIHSVSFNRTPNPFIFIDIKIMIKLIPHENFTVNLYSSYINDIHHFTAVIKAGWEFSLEGKLTRMVNSPAIEEVDTYYGEPNKSSLIAAHEIMPYKKRSEILLYGTAQITDKSTHITQVSVAIEWPNQKPWQKILNIFGPRYWQSTLVGCIPGKPTALEPLSLRYEYAYGGKDPKGKQKVYSKNPAGLGFTESSRIANLQMPQIENENCITKISEHPKLAGFAPIPIAWQLADKPIDKPIAISNVAPTDQQFEQPFVGNEKIILKGLVSNVPPKQAVILTIPTDKPELHLTVDSKQQFLKPVCDTLVINTDNMQCHLIWRANIPWPLDIEQSGDLKVIAK